MDHAYRATVVWLWSAAFGQQLAYDRSTGAVDLHGPADPSAFHVYIGDARTPILGDYDERGNSVRFTPRFPFLAGREHRAEYRGLVLKFTPSAEPGRIATRATAVYPSSPVVPANLLRMYVVFSQPMMREDFGDRIRLIDSSGREVPQTFLHVEGGLWNQDATRLTLLFEPGRIKSGLEMHDKLGFALRPAEHYMLFISKSMRDAFGEPLASDFTREFTAGPEDRASPNIATWIIRAPRAGTRDPIEVDAGEPLDEPLFQRSVRIGRLDGESEVVNAGTTWRFIPSEPWSPGENYISVAAELEDLAGNRPTRLFEVTSSADSIRASAEPVLRKFVVH